MLNLLACKLGWTKAELLVKIRLLSCGEGLIVVDLVLCDVLEVFVVEAVQNLLVVVGLIDDLNIDQGCLSGFPTALDL